MAAAVHYSLEVTRLDGLQWKPDATDLYFKVAFDKRKITGAISKNASWAGLETVTFSSLDMSSCLDIRIKAVPQIKEVLRKKQVVLGKVSISIAELLTGCAGDEVRLTFNSETSRDSADAIHLRFKEIDLATRAEIDIKSATRCIDRIIGSANSAGRDEMIQSFFQIADKVVGAVDKLAKTSTYLNIAWQATFALYRVVSNQIKGDNNCVDMVESMTEAFGFARDAEMLSNKTGRLTEVIGELFAQTIDCCHFVEKYTTPRFLGRMLHIDRAQKIDQHKQRFVDLKKRLDTILGLHTAIVTDHISDRVDILELKQKLDPSLSDTSTRPRCLPETRTKYLQQITDWLDSPTDCNILWLKGIAGSGKSTVAATVRDCCGKASRLAAYIFFERGKDEYRSMIRTIAYQLAEYDKKIGSCIARAVDRDKYVGGASAASQFETLLLKPLQDAKDSVNGQILVTLDALDECGSVDQRREILKLLKTDFADLPTKFRFLVTSRPEDDIMHSLSKRRHIRTVELDHASDDSRHDVLKYISREMLDIIETIPHDLNWDFAMKALSDAAYGLFIWASTAIKMIRESDDPLETLEDLLRDIRSLGTYRLDDLYATVLQQSGISWGHAKSRDRFARVIGLVLFAKESLTCEVIDGILGPSKSHLVLKKLGSVISFDPENVKPIRVHHASFGDYLTLRERSGDKPWFIDEQSQKRAITTGCFDIMEELLRFNICNLENSFLCNDCVPGLERRIEENVPPHLFYACRFWAEHLCDVPSPDNRISSDRLRTFTRRCLLYWFEVLSLTGNFNRIASRSLYNVFMWNPNNDAKFSSFLWDAYKLAGSFAVPISQSAPHIYLSALSLRKGESVVADHYSKIYPIVPVLVVGTKPPDPCIKIFKGHTNNVWTVAVSADGKLVASGSHDKTVRIWNAESGELVLDPLTSHSKWVMSVALSPDSKLVASGSQDGTVLIWSTESGEVVSGPLFHDDYVSSVAFSHDGKRIASGCYNGLIRVWDVESEKLVLGPLEGHTGTVRTLAFSLNGGCIISCSGGSIRIWDGMSGESIASPLQEHKHSSVAVSPDGRRIVSGSHDGAIRVWDADTDEVVLSPFKRDTEPIIDVAFSSSGQLIASKSEDGSMLVWDAKSGDVVSGPFQAGRGISVAFLPDGKRVVSGCNDAAVRIWDVQDRTSTPGTFEGHKSCVISVAFSPDGERVVSGSVDKSICVWDANCGALISGPFRGHMRSVISVAWFPDGQHIVSGSWDHSVRVWNSDTGETVLGPLEGHAGGVNSVAVSDNGKRIVSGSDDTTIRVWDAETGETLLAPLEGHEGQVYSVAISLDGRRIVSSSHDKSILVWDTATGEIVLGPLTGHTGDVKSVAFSKDGRRIVSGSGDETIRIWNAENGELVSCLFKGHTDWINSVAFFPNDKHVVSGSDDRSIRLWDVESGAVVSGPYYGHTDEVNSVSISPDGRHIASGSHDRTIRIWNVASDEFDANSEPSGCDNGDSLDGAIDVQGSSRNDAYPTTSLPKGYAVSNWKVSENGWVRGDEGELLIWIPEDMRKTLWHPHSTAVLSCQFSTKLDFSGAPMGEMWCKGYPLPRSDGGDFFASEELTIQQEQEATVHRTEEQDLTVKHEEDLTGLHHQESTVQREEELVVRPQRLGLEQPSAIALVCQWLLFLFNGIFHFFRNLFEVMASE